MFLKIFFILGIVLLTFIGFIFLDKNRTYKSSKSVASSYDRWTNDRLLENLWGEHIHLGFYKNRRLKDNFQEAKIEFVHQLVRWSGLDLLPRGSKILDVGCGIGGSARILAKDYGFNVLGVTISPAQVARAKELTPDGMTCSFEIMDALNLELDKASFDGVWSVEAGPHMPDKQLYADELLRVLKPGGVLAVADWNRRDSLDGQMNIFERLVMTQLLNQWTHPEFSSIAGFRNNLINSVYYLSDIETDDWTNYTVDSWYESILEGFRRPGSILGLGPTAVLKGLREVPTILMMRWAFMNRLMQFGVFRSKR